MPTPPLLERLKNARLGQALVVYLGAAWVVLQVTETVIGLLNLPNWVGPTAVVLMLVGLVVVLATAWIQGMPQTTAAEEAGEVPSDWEVDASDVLASVRAGRLPHLNWARVMLGGVVALSLLFGVAGAYVLVRGPIDFVGPTDVGAESAADGIAVLPFAMTGEGLELYGEGMVDLMSANLDGLSGYRAIDSRTVLARWSREVGEGERAELQTALRVAGSTGARYAVVGSGTDIGGRMRFTANIFDLADGSRVGAEARVDGVPDEVLGMVDDLTVRLIRSLLDATGEASTAQTFRLASLLTTSVPALRSYLEGDAHYRRGRFSEARVALQEAVAQDSTFAMAWWRLGEALGWEYSIGYPESREAKRRAAALSDRLPTRESTLLAISSAISNQRAHDHLADLRGYLQRYPDDPDGWYMLGEVGLHASEPEGITDAEVQRALYRAVDQDPTFLPYYDHALEWSSAKGDGERFMPLLAEYIRLGANDARVARMRYRWDLLHGDAETRPLAVAAADTLTQVEVIQRDQGILGYADENLERLEPLKRANRYTLGTPLQPGTPAGVQELYFAQGRFEELHALLEGNRTPTALAQYISYATLPGAPETEQTRRWVREAAAELPASFRGQNPADLFSRAFASLWLDDGTPYAAVRADLMEAVDRALQQIPPGAIDTTGVRGAVGGWLEARRLAARGEYAEAYSVLGQALGTAGGVFGGSGLHSDMGEFAVRSSQWDEAIRIFEGISRSANERTWAKFRLGQAYEAVGDTARAIDAYRTFLARTESADPWWEAPGEARLAVERLGGGA